MWIVILIIVLAASQKAGAVTPAPAAGAADTLTSWTPPESNRYTVTITKGSLATVADKVAGTPGVSIIVKEDFMAMNDFMTITANTQQQADAIRAIPGVQSVFQERVLTPQPVDSQPVLHPIFDGSPALPYQGGSPTVDFRMGGGPGVEGQSGGLIQLS